MNRFKKDINPDNGRFEVPMEYSGRKVTLIKREQAPAAPWYLRLVYRGKPYWRSTDTDDGDVAVHRARGLMDAILNEDKETIEATKLRDPLKYASLKQVFDIYRAQAVVVRRTIGGNISALRSMLRVVRGTEVDVEAVKVDELTARFVRDYQGKMIERVRSQKVAAQAERNALARVQRTANSTWLQARSIFVQDMMSKYRDAELVFPKEFETGFLKAPKIKGIEKTRYEQPGDALIQATLAAARAIMAEVLAGGAEKSNDRRRIEALELKDRMAVAFILEIGCGLRKGELMAARGSWIGRINGQFCVSLPKENTKNQQPRRLRVPEEFGGFVEGYIERRKIAAGDPLLPNGERVMRAVGKWLRGLGWNGSKTNHALRKYFGYLVARKYGLEAAQSALDHADISTTQDAYTGILKTEGVVVELPAADAKAEPKPENIVAMPAIAVVGKDSIGAG